VLMKSMLQMIEHTITFKMTHDSGGYNTLEMMQLS